MDFFLALPPTQQAILMVGFLFVKHFVVDFPLQAFPYQYKNKGTYGHPGGLLHSGLHALGTLITLAPFAAGRTEGLLLVAFLDGFVHYHIDWAKMNLNQKMGWTPTNSEKFWILLGVDQLLHALTYVVIVWYSV